LNVQVAPRGTLSKFGVQVSMLEVLEGP